MPEPRKSAVSTSAPLTRSFTIQNGLGLHARPAALLAKEMRQHAEVEVEVQCGAVKANAKNVFDLLALGAECGTELTFRISGPAAAAAMAAVERLFANKFGEP
jgi:phosphotransferase system HPr (HPr) family protein